jgi:hypothetical protein
MMMLLNCAAIFAFPLLLINIFVMQAHGAASLDNVVFCSDIVPDADSSSFEVCATASYTSPSPAQFENGTVVLMGGYSNVYTIVQGLKEGDESTGSLNEKADIEVSVSRDDSGQCDVFITMNDETAQCNSCSYCDNDSYSVDCTNIENGRSTYESCESSGQGVVFFPLTADALESPLENAITALITLFAQLFLSFIARLFG